MKVDPKQLTLYAVTDRTWLNGRTLEEAVEEAIRGGATFVQLRDKNEPYEVKKKTAIALQSLCRKYGVPFVIDDDVELAAEVDADGVHVGQDDMAYEKAREILGEGKIIGVTAHNLKEAVRAWKQGADYIGSGAAFGSSTKTDAGCIDREEYGRIISAVDIPVVAIGGINKDNIEQLYGYGLAGASIISGIFAAENIEETCRELRALAEKLPEQNLK